MFTIFPPPSQIAFRSHRAGKFNKTSKPREPTETRSPASAASLLLQEAIMKPTELDVAAVAVLLLPTQGKKPMFAVKQLDGPSRQYKPGTAAHTCLQI